VKRLFCTVIGVFVVLAIIVAGCGGGKTSTTTTTTSSTTSATTSTTSTPTDEVNACFACHSDEALLMQVATTEEEPVSKLIEGEC
jgi:hypothetical protein